MPKIKEYPGSGCIKYSLTYCPEKGVHSKLFVAKKQLGFLGIPISDHDKLPDVVLLDEKKNWLYLIKVVTSHGPMTPKRVFELEKMFSECDVGKIYVTAFPDMSEFKKHIKDVAWETEVWIADIPDHMIHYNGDRFLGPRETA